MGQRRRGREYAVQMLYQIDQTDVEASEVYGTFWDGIADPPDELREFTERLVDGVVERRDEIDRWIDGCTSNWRIDRMPVVDRNVLRLAVHEMASTPDTPAAVVIDEAIEISKKFGSEESGKFINGVLDAIRRRIEAEGPGALAG